VVIYLSGLMAYEQVSQTLQRVGGYSVPVTTVWEQVQHVGERLVEQQQRTCHQVGLDRIRWDDQRYDPRLRKGVSMDGGMVNIRDEGWKELKVGVMATLLPPEQQRDDEPLGHDLHYCAVLGDVADFTDPLWALAVECQVPYAGHVAVTADGAPWIWRLSADLFPCSTQIVDWYHAAQHLAQAAQTRFPNDEAAAKAWTEQLKGYLSLDEVWRVIDELKAAALATPLAYFEEHRYRMLYATFRACGYPIGSGTTESAVKQYKQRLCGPGMRWSRAGAQRILLIRSAVLNHTFDQLELAA
jgi:hypothetical protein